MTEEKKEEENGIVIVITITFQGLLFSRSIDNNNVARTFHTNITFKNSERKLTTFLSKTTK